MIARGMAFDAESPNPFQWKTDPQSAAEHEQNYQHWMWERMSYESDLRAHQIKSKALTDKAATDLEAQQLLSEVQNSKVAESEMRRRWLKARHQEQAQGLKSRGARLERGRGLGMGTT